MGTPQRTFSGSLGNYIGFDSSGHEFTVVSSLRIDSLGCFALSGAAPPAGVTITVKVAASSALSSILATAQFTEADPGTADVANQILYRSISAVDLPPGTYRIWACGYTAGYKNHYDDAGTGGTNVAKSTIGGLITQANDYYSIAGTCSGPTTLSAVVIGSGVLYGSATPTGSIIFGEDTGMTFDDIIPFTPTDSAANGLDLYQLAPTRYQCGFWTNQDATLVVVTARGNTRTIVVKAGFFYKGRLKTVKSTGTTASTVVNVGVGQGE